MNAVSVSTSKTQDQTGGSRPWPDVSASGRIDAEFGRPALLGSTSVQKNLMPIFLPNKQAPTPPPPPLKRTSFVLLGNPSNIKKKKITSQPHAQSLYGRETFPFCRLYCIFLSHLCLFHTSVYVVSHLNMDMIDGQECSTFRLTSFVRIKTVLYS